MITASITSGSRRALLRGASAIRSSSASSSGDSKARSSTIGASKRPDSKQPRPSRWVPLLSPKLVSLCPELALLCPKLVSLCPELGMPGKTCPGDMSAAPGKWYTLPRDWPTACKKPSRSNRAKQMLKSCGCKSLISARRVWFTTCSISAVAKISLSPLVNPSNIAPNRSRKTATTCSGTSLSTQRSSLRASSRS